MLGTVTLKLAEQQGEQINTHQFAPVPAEKQKYAGLQTSNEVINFNRNYSHVPFILCERFVIVPCKDLEVH